MLTAIFSAFAAVFNFLTGRSAAKNRPDMVQAKTAQGQQADRDTASKDVAGAESGSQASLDDLRRRESE